MLFRWFITLLIAIPFSAQAMKPVDASQTYAEIEAIGYTKAKDQVDIQGIQTLEDQEWTSLSGTANLGYDTDVFWFRFDIQNPTGKSLTRLLELSYPLLDDVHFFHVQNGMVLSQYRTGDRLVFSQRPVDHRNFVFPIDLPANTVHTLYLRIQTSGAVQVPLTLWEERVFHIQSEKNTFTRALFYGLLLVMAAFNLSLFFFLKDKAYLPYSACVLFILLVSMSLHGFSFQYFYPKLPGLHELVIMLSVPLFLVNMSKFTNEFLELKRKRNKYWLKTSQAIGYAALASALFALILPYGLSTRISVIISLPACLFALTAGLYFWARGERNAKLFSIAWISLLFGVTTTVLNKIGVLSNNAITENSILFGTAAQSILFSLALAERFNREKEARMNAERQSLKQRIATEEKLLFAARHNELSGLPNRSVFEFAVQKFINEISTAKNSVDINITVVLLHLCHFDDVNKTLGHKNADDLIRLFSQRFASQISALPSAIEIETLGQEIRHIAHVEGVTFALALSGIPKAQLQEEIERIVQILSQPVEFMGLDLDLNFIAGCAHTDKPKASAQSLLQEAFIAFDQLGSARSDVALYTPEMNPYSPRRLTLMSELRQALDRDDLFLCFQPQIRLADGEISGFEALIRWIHADHGFIPPDEFIPMAEQTGLIKQLTHWVVEKAITFCLALEQQGCKVPVSINISAVNLSELNFSEKVLKLREQSGLGENRLVMEVTETAAMSNPKTALSALAQLREANFRLSIDDFGTGHSSLSYIRQLPVHEIKIDRSFVMDMDKNDSDKTIVRTMVNLCHDLGFEVVAEGVENEQILQLLSEMQCEFAQGYHIAKPMKIDDVLAWVANRTKDKTRSTL